MGSTKPAGVIAYICSSGSASSPKSCLSDSSIVHSQASSLPPSTAQSLKMEMPSARPLSIPKPANSRTPASEKSATKSSITSHASSSTVTDKHKGHASSSTVTDKHKGHASSSTVTGKHKGHASSSTVTGKHKGHASSSTVTGKHKGHASSSTITPLHLSVMMAAEARPLRLSVMAEEATCPLCLSVTVEEEEACPLCLPVTLEGEAWPLHSSVTVFISHASSSAIVTDERRGRAFSSYTIMSDTLKHTDELNGMVLLCKVCGDVASGFHYGVHACEGCKGFFRRSIQQNIQYKKCMKSENCTIMRINRNRCQQCRFKKCLAVGMSRDAVRFGRIPKREKQRMLLEMQNAMNSVMTGAQLHQVLRDSSACSPSSSSSSLSPPSSPQCSQDSESLVPMDTMSLTSSCSSDSGEEDSAPRPDGFHLAQSGGALSLGLSERLSNSNMTNIPNSPCESRQQITIRYHSSAQPDNASYCHYSRPNLNELAGISANRRHLVCPMNTSPIVDPSKSSHEIWEEFSMSFTPAVREVVEFARQIPGFRELSQHDQVSLLKAGTFEVLMVRFSSLFDVKQRTVSFLSGRSYSIEALRSMGAGELLSSMFDFSEKLMALQLSPEEISLFTALVLVSADRTGIEDMSSVEALQENLIRALRNLIMKNHSNEAAVFTKLLLKLPELRSLNNMHSEELLSFKVHP